MTQPQKNGQKGPAHSSDAKVLLSTLRMTTAVGAIGLTLGGWGLLARAEAFAATQNTQVAAPGFTGSATGLVVASATATPKQIAAVIENGAANRATERAEAEAHDKGESDPGERESDHNGALTQSRKVASVFLPTATAAPAATAAPTATAAPVTKFNLNVVQWVSTQAGDPVAVVKDNQGVLWYVWGPDVTRIEQGLTPEYPPQAVNAVTRSRAS